MTSISKFDTEIYSEELHQVSESEHDEAMSLMADDEQKWKGYSDWSQAVEEAAWTGAQSFNGVTVRKQCEHKDSRTSDAKRISGSEVSRYELIINRGGPAGDL